MSTHLFDIDGKPFWRPERLLRLGQLISFGPSLPAWATSRWILAQAMVVLDEPSRGRHRKASEIAIRARGGPRTLKGLSSFDARVKVMDHDWIYRQLVLFELGGLAHFVTRVASPDLLVGADRIDEWRRTPMGGFRLVEKADRHLVFEALGAGDSIEPINLGGATLLEVGDCVIGRAVPIEAGTMWESAPLMVPDEVARRVADEPHGWVGAIEEACREPGPGGKPTISTFCNEFGMLTDVPEPVRLGLARLVAEQGPPRPKDMSLGDLVRDDAKRFVLAAVAGELDEYDLDQDLASPWPPVAASLLEPGVLELVVDALSPSDAAAVATLADRLAGPAADLCRWLALELRQSA